MEILEGVICRGHKEAEAEADDTLQELHNSSDDQKPNSITA